MTQRGVAVRPSGARAIWLLIAVGTAIRLVLAFTTKGGTYDLRVLADIRAALGHVPLHVYEVRAGPSGATHWPYAPGFFPFIGLAGFASSVTGLAYTSLIRIPSIAADIGIALLVNAYLARRDAPQRERLAAVALVSLGPSFIAIAGYHGQIDNLAILPAVAALVIWDRAPEPRRALYAGLLIGLGAAVKTTPIFMVLALLPAVRSWREAAVMTAAAVAVPLAAIAPFLATTPHAVSVALRYRGFPGTSGLAILLQPDFADAVRHYVQANSLSRAFYDKGQLLTVAAIAAASAFAVRRRPVWQPADRAVLIWLAFYAVTPAFFFQYLVWGLPFFLMAGRLRLAAAVQLLALVPTVIFYRAPWESRAAAVVYGVAMVLLWAFFVVSLARVARGREQVVVA